MSFVVEPLGDHDLGKFDCGIAEINDWLQHHAANATGQGTRTFLLTAAGRVVGYFAIAPHYLDQEEAPRQIARGAPRQIPAILLAKLALDRTMQGKGLGAELLAAALTTIVGAARRAGGRVVVVDAIDDEAASFYRHHAFLPGPVDPNRLVIKLSTAAKALGLSWP